MVKLSVEEAVKVLNRYDNEHYTPKTREAHRMAIAALTNSNWTPVGVVQCKDCRWWKDIHAVNECGLCKHSVFTLEDDTIDPMTEPNDFCSYGVRR